ncbi:aminotransferase class V-fold PLP-dependent enzyme [Devosia sp. PTR5]|uniref:Aminotransferase class V-fold PLP-dependent enzyme n=1 Tax=Devosia oryzisoli TaxID=2774138 RepID=A0A927FW75_9HYPH|nr:aminotransferase class V-fold PLP-dependent enzyme [Devosia oryzisoli]MBD8065993.1 aminotransferase class V-fold PLP-dependent enzyme [Devosia oryzisoli]
MNESDETARGRRLWVYEHRFSEIINVGGNFSAIGSSVATAAVRAATADAMACFIDINEMQAAASETIARLTGAAAGCLTSCASAAVTICVAATMTGLDLALVESLPAEAGERDEVVLQLGHVVDYGAPLLSAIKLAGGKPRIIGQVSRVFDHQLEAALSERTAAALYVVSHLTAQNGQIPLERFVELAHARGIPVIVDAAAERDFRSFIAAGADLVIYSGHKVLAGPTSGIIAGRKELVRAAYLQNAGIARGMKIGKEGIAGAIVAMEQALAHPVAANKPEEILAAWCQTLTALKGLSVERRPDPIATDMHRLKVTVNRYLTGFSAAALAQALGQRRPRILVRDFGISHGYFELDPSFVSADEAELVAEAIKETIIKSTTLPDKGETDHRNGKVNSYLRWLE